MNKDQSHFDYIAKKIYDFHDYHDHVGDSADKNYDADNNAPAPVPTPPPQSFLILSQK